MTSRFLMWPVRVRSRPPVRRRRGVASVRSTRRRHPHLSVRPRRRWARPCPSPSAGAPRYSYLCRAAGPSGGRSRTAGRPAYPPRHGVPATSRVCTGSPAPRGFRRGAPGRAAGPTAPTVPCRRKRRTRTESHRRRASAPVIRSLPYRVKSVRPYKPSGRRCRSCHWVLATGTVTIPGKFVDSVHTAVGHYALRSA